jgi:transposase
MTYDELLLFVVKQQKLTGNVVTCHEAGGFGFHLHRRLEELGIKNYVVQPQDWDERGKGVKNDRLDAAALCQRLDRYERGNKKAFSPVRIPTVGEERKRAISRQQQEFPFGPVSATRARGIVAGRDKISLSLVISSLAGPCCVRSLARSDQPRP